MFCDRPTAPSGTIIIDNISCKYYYFGNYCLQQIICYAGGRALKNMKIKREFITPYITFLFLVLGLSGILMFLHVFDDYTQIVHESIGLAFVIFSILHIIINWTSLKIHFKKRVFITSAIVVLLLSVGLVIYGKIHVNEERIIKEKLFKAPISIVFSILDIEYDKAEIILKNQNIIIAGSNNLEEVCRKNKKSPDEILELIIQ